MLLKFTFILVQHLESDTVTDLTVWNLESCLSEEIQKCRRRRSSNGLFTLFDIRDTYKYKKQCNLEFTHGKTIFFNFPVMIQIMSNIIFFGLTIRNCSKIKSELQQMQINSNARLKYNADINK
ncbi:hypothetical protein J6590_059089 [Homalodisca vitripennis]|nr:hypothetical protein J6590_059089 [Homalodisca vitripennis]